MCEMESWESCVVENREMILEGCLGRRRERISSTTNSTYWTTTQGLGSSHASYKCNSSDITNRRLQDTLCYTTQSGSVLCRHFDTAAFHRGTPSSRSPDAIPWGTHTACYHHHSNAHAHPRFQTHQQEGEMVDWVTQAGPRLEAGCVYPLVCAVMPKIAPPDPVRLVHIMYRYASIGVDRAKLSLRRVPPDQIGTKLRAGARDPSAGRVLVLDD